MIYEHPCAYEHPKRERDISSIDVMINSMVFLGI